MANNFTEKANFIWSVADLIRDDFKRGKYQDVILPLTVLRRIDCVLEPKKDKVLSEYSKYKDQLKDTDKVLRRASGYAFYNTSKYTFDRLLGDPNNIAKNLNAYINGFSENMREVIDRFDFRNTISKLNEANLLYLVLQRFTEIDLHPNVVDNHEMGTIFEELIRRFNEALDENPGEHFTPRDVVRLMVMLLFAVGNEILKVEQRVIKFSDPACGTGGMLTIAKEQALEINPKLDIYLYGQEVNPETFAVCKSDLYMKSADGRDAENIAFGSTLSHDAHTNERFDYQLANPPYGKEWKRDEEPVKAEAAKPNGRFSAGTPRISDGQLLFLQHMLSHMAKPENGGGRVAIVMNGSPLFTGDAGSGESEIRRWILENDWLETIVALPEQLFYNTGIATYIWVLSNHKTKERQGKVQLIDATSFWKPMRKSLGDKRREMSAEDLKFITELYQRFEEGEHSKIFNNKDFGYRKITVERPLRLNFQVSQERLARLIEQSAFVNLAQSKKKDAKAKKAEETEGKKQQATILDALATLPKQLFKNRLLFEMELNKVNLSLPASVRKSIVAALSERDEIADPVPALPAKSAKNYETESMFLAQEVLTQLHEICQTILSEAKLDRELSVSQNTTFLFAEASVTEKVMAVEVVTNQLGLDVNRVDLSTVVSKYIGETEKNLRRLFDAAQDGGAILFFDEADALFGKRSEVKDSDDRYANIEINYFLQRMEAYRGLVILATSKKRALDKSSLRRLRFIVDFRHPASSSSSPDRTEYEPDPELRDTENVPLSEDINAFFEREVKPHVSEAWINHNVRDEKDGKVGKVGYEINFNRYFYEYQPPRDLEEIEAEIKTLEKEIMDMLKEVTE